MTYLGIAAGRVPGLALDRTGWAVLGASAFLISGAVPLAQVGPALDVPTLCVLFGMMLLSAQFRHSGLYAATVERLAQVRRPRLLLLGTIGVVALLSAVLTNDVVCLALTPLLLGALLRGRSRPLPYLAAIACASNLGSALTPIGNPQNILIAQRMALPFPHFVAVCAMPVVLSLAALYGLLARQVGRQAAGVDEAGAGQVSFTDGRPPGSLPWDMELKRCTADLPPVTPGEAHTTPADTHAEAGGAEAAVGVPGAVQLAVPLAIDRWAAAKALALTVAALALFLSPVPAGLTALGVGATVLMSRRLPTRVALAEVDWSLLALFASLFVVQRGVELSGWTMAARNALAGAGLQLSQPTVLIPVTALLSNLVSNVPAVMLLLPFVHHSPPTGYALALASTLAGNAVLVGSIANLIVAAQAERLGVRFGFADHLRIGLPITFVSLSLSAVELAWLAVR